MLYFLGSFTSILHYQHDFNNTIIPMLMDKLEAVDDDTSAKLHSFFVEYERAVRSVTGMQAKAHVVEQLKHGGVKGDTSPLEVSSESPGTLSQLNLAPANNHTFHPEAPEPNEALQDYALSFLLRHPHVSTVLVGMSSPEQVESVLNCAKKLERS